MAEMKDQKLAAAEAEERMKLIAPLLAPGLSRETLAEMKRKICEDYHISDRTLRKYLQQYRESGFEGLKPLSRYIVGKQCLWGPTREKLVKAASLKPFDRR